jgi:peptidoglycan/LPS O-acetylase OafA/YrhL
LQPRKLTYRPDIDGLRAVAVLAVIANHLPQKFLPSGFLGVDVFFVISGFVVSASLLDGPGGRFSNVYANFLSRRVKRLLPALIVCVAVTCLLVLRIDPHPRDSIVTGISALFGVANITLFNLGLDYFSASSKLNAFTHTWSLGVEEQFYVAFPLLAWLTVLGKPDRTLNSFAKTVALLSVVSALSFVWLYNSHTAAVYYLMPSRIWELGSGALMFVYTSAAQSTRATRIFAWLSPVALLALLVCFSAPPQHAAWVTLIAVGLTALLLGSTGPSMAAQCLSQRPIVYIGKISYSLYLWHWPVVALAPMALSVDWRLSSLYLAAMMVAAVGSYHVVERPLRKAAWTRSKVRDIGLGFSCSLVVAGVVLLVHTNYERVVDPNYKPLYPKWFLPTINSGLPYDTCVVDDLRPPTKRTFDECTTPPKPGRPMIWAMGDSHIGHLQGMLQQLYYQFGIGVHYIETPAREFPAGVGDEYPGRMIIFDQVLQKLKPGDIVLISRLYLTRNSPPSVEQGIFRWMPRVAELAKQLRERGATLVVTGPPPMFDFEDIRECDITHRQYCSVKRTDIAAPIAQVMTQLDSLRNKNNNLFVFDLFELLCPHDTDFCYPDDNGQFLYRDKDHFNSLGSKRLAEPFAVFLRSSGVLPR